MLKLLISDDEPMICQLIKNILNWDELGYEVVGMAYTGVDALRMIKEKLPDVVITDIRMPGFDGLELIRSVKEAGINTEFIMISGFRQFEYAQTAMKYGVKYYLLKPIEEETLCEIVREIKLAVQSRNQEAVYHSSLEKQIAAEKVRTRRQLLYSMTYEISPENPKKRFDPGQINGEYHTNFSEGSYRVFFIKIDHDHHEEPFLHTILGKIEQITLSMTDQWNESISMEFHSGLLTLINYPISEEEHVRESLLQLYETIRNYISQFKGFCVVIGVGRKVHSLASVNESIKSAVDAVRYRIRVREAIIFSEDYSYMPYDISQLVTPVQRQTFLSRLETHDSEGAVDFLVSVIRKIRFGNENYSPVCYFDVLAEYIDCLEDFCRHHDYYDKEMIEIVKRWDQLTWQAASESVLQEITLECVKTCISRIAELQSERDSRPIRRIKEYIEKHYKEDINLAQLSEIAAMNPTYISTIFKKETGMSYSEYLSAFRLKKAKQLLEETNMSIREVALAIGYRDARYFSKQFIRQIGLKPLEYRKLYS